MPRRFTPRVPACLHFAIISIATCLCFTPATAKNVCQNPVYLTFEAGNMEAAPVVAAALRRQGVRATFFAANERTVQGDGSLGNYWAPWWKARAAEGHEFASNTYDRVVWHADLPGVERRFRIQPSVGALAGREFTWDAAKYCAQISYAAERLQDFTGKKPLPLFRAPGGKTSKRLLESAGACGYAHVGWSATGVLGDDWPSERFSNAVLLNKALQDVRSGDILLAHLGTGGRKDPWAVAVLEPLLLGLKARGFCFQTLREHPSYQAWIAAHGS